MIFRTFLLILLLASCDFQDAEQANIDLSKLEFWAKAGFQEDWTHQDIDASWLKIPGSQDGNRPLRVKDLPLKEIPERAFLSLTSHDYQTFTFLTKFRLTAKQYHSGHFNAIYLAQISDNWQIYLNGKLLINEFHLDDSGVVQRSRNVRDQVLYLNPMLFKAGENRLVFRIHGDPSFHDTGLYRGGPYLLGHYSKLSSMSHNWLDFALVGVYCFLGLYHLFLFLIRKKNRYNLYYALFTLALLVYLLARFPISYQLVADTSILFRLEFLALYCLIPFMVLFLDSILLHTISRSTKAIVALNIILFCLTIPVNMSLAVDILRIWQFFMPIVTLIFIIKLSQSFYSQYLHDKENNPGRHKLAIIISSLRHSVIGNILIGFFVLSAAALWDVLNSFFIAKGGLLAPYAFFAFVISIALILSNRFLYTHNRIEALNQDLEHKIFDLNEAKNKIFLSKQRYKFIVEGSNDIIFTLDNQMRILSVSQALERQLKYPIHKVLGRDFIGLFYLDQSKDKFSYQVIKKILDDFLDNKKPLNLKVDFIHAGTKEAKEMNLSLEYIDSEGKGEIVGKATSVAEDTLRKFFQQERQRYTIGNTLSITEEICHRLTRNLPKYFNESSIGLIRMGLREIIINAIEHGNLNVSFEDKSQATMRGEYIDFILERQKDPRYKDRHVTIDYSLNSRRVIYRIADQGSGFDYNKTIQKDVDDINELMLYHGRGIALAKEIFDEIRYNESGNQVLLIKKPEIDSPNL